MRVARRRHDQTDFTTQPVKLLFVVYQLLSLLFFQPIQQEFASLWRVGFLHFHDFQPIHQQQKIQLGSRTLTGVAAIVFQEKAESVGYAAQKLVLLCNRAIQQIATNQQQRRDLVIDRFLQFLSSSFYQFIFIGNDSPKFIAGECKYCGCVKHRFKFLLFFRA